MTEIDIEQEIAKQVKEQVALALKNKAKKPKSPRKKVKLPTILTNDQMHAIIDSFNEKTRTGYRNKTYILFCLRNALRSEEAISIRYEDIRITKDKNGDEAIFYRLLSSKSGHQADIPLSRDTYNRFLEISKRFKSRQLGYVFRPVKANTKMDTRYFRRIANNIGKKLGFHFNLHQLRHFSLSDIYAKTSDIKKVQLVARHRSVTSAEPYIHVQPQAVREATELIDF